MVTLGEVKLCNKVSLIYAKPLKLLQKTKDFLADTQLLIHHTKIT